MLKLNGNPTFDAEVLIQQICAPSEALRCTFRAKGKKALIDFMERAKSQDDLSLIEELLVGWDLPDTLSRENLETFLDAHIHAARNIMEGYLDAIAGAAEKN